MPYEVIDRRASENKYLHKDFHGAMSIALDYIAEHYGSDAVREYLWQFASSFYVPLKKEIAESGLNAIEKHFNNIYCDEAADFKITLNGDELLIEVTACPAVTHMRENGYKVSPYFIETTKTVNEAIVDGTSWAVKLIEYDVNTGKSKQRFYRKEK